MVKTTTEFIDDLSAVFRKHKVSICVTPEYDGLDDYCGDSIEILSDEFVDDALPIYVDDFRGFVNIIDQIKKKQLMAKEEREHAQDRLSDMG